MCTSGWECCRYLTFEHCLWFWHHTKDPLFWKTEKADHEIDVINVGVAHHKPKPSLRGAFKISPITTSLHEMPITTGKIHKLKRLLEVSATISVCNTRRQGQSCGGRSLVSFRAVQCPRSALIRVYLISPTDIPTGQPDRNWCQHSWADCRHLQFPLMAE